jgi:hypothetical protein
VSLRRLPAPDGYGPPLIRDAAVFSLNEIALKRDGWPIFERLLEEEALRTEPPISPGVYLLALPRHYLSYPGGSSRVFYLTSLTVAEL